MEPAEHYRSQREWLSDLYATLSPEQLATVVPGSPKWTVRDALGHMVGVTASVCEGAMDNAGSPAWTQAQVEARRDRSVAELLEEWGKRGVGFEEAIPQMGFMGWVFVYDVTMHGDDVREALGMPLGSTPTHAAVLDGIIAQAGRRAKEIGTLTMRAGDRSWEIGSGEPRAELVARDAGELARVVGARRSDEQVLAMDWQGDPTPWLEALPLFREGR